MKGLYIPTSGFPEILTDDLLKIKSSVFGNHDTTVLTFDGYTNYYVYSSIEYLYSPVNKIATFFRRLYSNNYTINNIVRGPVLICGSVDGIPGVIDSSVPRYFLEQLFRYYGIYLHEFG